MIKKRVDRKEEEEEEEGGRETKGKIGRKGRIEEKIEIGLRGGKKEGERGREERKDSGPAGGLARHTFIPASLPALISVYF